MTSPDGGRVVYEQILTLLDGWDSLYDGGPEQLARAISNVVNTTHAETIRGLDGFAKRVRDEGDAAIRKLMAEVEEREETIRRLEGEVARLKELNADADNNFWQLDRTLRQRAEAAEGLVEAVGQLRAHTWTTADGGCRPDEISMREWALLIRRVIDLYEALTPATGEGA